MPPVGSTTRTVDQMLADPAFAEQDRLEEEFDLESFLERSPDPVEPQSEWVREEFGEAYAPPDPRSPDAEDHADQILSKILASRDRQARIKDGWKEKLRREESREKGLLRVFGGWLREFVSCRAKARKSVLLDSGKVGFRAKKASLKIVDPTALALWALDDHPELVTHTFKGTVANEVDANAKFWIPEGTKIALEVPPAPNQDRAIGEIAGVFLHEWNGTHDFEVKQADALAYLQATGEVPYACELVPAEDDLVLQAPAKVKKGDTE